MKTILHILMMICLGSSSLHASTIKATTHKSFVGKTVNLIQYTDYITYGYKVIASTQVDEKQQFLFNTTNKEAAQYVIQIEDLVGNIYVDPSTSYNIYFYPVSVDGVYKMSRNEVEILFDTLPKTDINKQIIDCDLMIDKFLFKNQNYVGTPQFKKALDTLKQEASKAFGSFKKPLLQNYVKYSIGTFDLIALSDDQQINKLYNYQTYIYNHPVQTNDQAFMTYFNKFYDKTLATLAKNHEYELLDAASAGNYTKLDTTLRQDFYCKRKSVRELVIVSNIFEMYHDDRLYKKGARAILDSIIEKGSTKEIKNIAEQVKYQLTKTDEGSEAYDFTLTDKNNKKVRLSDFKGKYVYINFWATWSKDALAEMALFERFQKEYGKHIEFVSINIDSKRATFDSYIASHPNQDWNMLYFDGDANLLETYEVTSVPHYVFIDQEGKIIQSPAQRPATSRANYVSIDKTFFEINKKLTKTKRFQIGR